MELFPAGDGELARHMRARDWSSSPLGPPATWPQSLRTTVGLLLPAGAQIVLFWGADYVALYNDAYAPTIGDKHPRALGRPAAENWAELWEDLEPLLRSVRETGATFQAKDRPFYIERHGYGETVYFDISYSPVPDEAGGVGGVLCIVSETSARVRAERHQAFLVEIVDVLRAAGAPLAVKTAAAEALGRRLGVARAGYGDIVASGEVVSVERDWTDGTIPSLAGEARVLDAFGPEVIAELRAGRTLVVQDCRSDPRTADPRHLAAWDSIGARALVVVPLVREGGLRAVLYAHSAAARTWLPEEVRLVEHVAARTWSAYAQAQAEAAEHATRAHLAAMFDQATVGISECDGEGRFVRVNDRYCEIVGRSRAELLTLRMHDITHPDDLPGNAASYAQAASQGEPFEIVKRYIRPDGSIVWAHNNVTAIREANGAVNSVLCVTVDITEQRRAEEASRESEARFQLLAQSIEEVFYLADHDQRRIAYVSPSYERLWGRPARELYEDVTAYARAIHPDDRPAAEAAFARQAVGEATEVEYRIVRSDGAVRWILDRSYPVNEASRRLAAGVAEDITARREAEARLRELNATLERQVEERTAERDRMWDTSPDLMLIIDFEGYFRRVNPAWTTLLGYQPHELVGRHVNAFALPDDHAETVHAYEVGSGGRPVTVNRFRHKDGSVRWISWAAAPAGQVFYVTGRDVTADREREAELAAAEAARRKADALYRAYFENTPEALFVVGVEPDGAFVVEEINPAHEAGVGLKLEDIRGKRMEDILPEPLARPVLEAYRHVMQTGVIYQYREEFDLSGEPQHWDTSLVPMRDETGRIVRLIGSSRNVTRQVIAEEALRQSQKMEAIGQLTGGVAHDFNNLLTPIVGALDMLQRKGVGGERERRLIAGAAQSAERAKTLVQRLLAFARRQPLEPVAVDVGQLVTGMADLIASTTGPQIKVVVNVGRDLPPAKADANQLEMAVLNLAVNARDAMPDGGTLRISVETETVGRQHRSGLKPGRYLHLSVGDTGVGMDEATLARAVEPFFSTKGVGKGTGLGLSMAHGLASQLGGALAIRSTPGVGTNVELWLPQGVKAAPAAAPVQDGEPTPPTLGTVLLVDDEDLVRLTTADMLIELGYNVIEAASGEEALRLLDRGLTPDVVVTDHLMPGMSGTDLARAVQTDRPSVRVLVVSGYAETAGITPDLPRLTKPFRNAELAASLAMLVKA